MSAEVEEVEFGCYVFVLLGDYLGVDLCARGLHHKKGTML